MQQRNPHPVSPSLTPQARAPLFASIVIAGAICLAGCGKTDSSDHHTAGTSAETGMGTAAGTAAPAISLESAIVGGDDTAVHAHILAGTAVNTQNMSGDTPLGIAAVFGRAYAAEVLIGAGAELETKNRSGVTPLFSAAFFCHPEVVRVLTDAGADTSTTDANGMTIKQVMEMPWVQIEPVYAAIYRGIGIPFDADRIESSRPTIAAMLP